MSFIAHSTEAPARKSWLIAVAALFAQLWLLGNICIEGIDKFTWDISCLTKNAIILVAAFVVAYALLVELVRLLEAEPRKHKGMIANLALVLERHPIAIPMIVVLACWLPWLIIAWPGTTDPYDNLDQLMQWHGILGDTARTVGLTEGDLLINGHHPVFHTMLINLFIDFGGALGSQNLGMFLYVALQELLLSWSLALCHSFMCRMKTPEWVRVVSVLIWSFCPVYAGWALSLTKDMAFTIAMLQLVLCLMCYIRDCPTAPNEQWRLAIRMFFVVLLTCLLRNNGIYCVLPVVAILLLTRRLDRVSISCYVATAIAFAVSSILYPSLGITPGSVREMLSVPFQQTARYVKAYPDDVTPEERDAIDAVLSYDQLAELYSPSLSDPIKGLFRTGSEDQLPAYFSAWLQMGLRHPGAYAAATIENTYQYYYPGTGAGWLWFNLNCWGLRENEAGIQDLYEANGFQIHQIEELKPARNAAIDLYTTYRKTDIVSYPGDVAFCAWVLIVATLLIARTHRWKRLIPLLPLLALYATVLLGPQNGNIRYMLPVIESMMLVAAWLIDCYRVTGSTVAIHSK